MSSSTPLEEKYPSSCCDGTSCPSARKDSKPTKQEGGSNQTKTQDLVTQVVGLQEVSILLQNKVRELQDLSIRLREWTDVAKQQQQKEEQIQKDRASILKQLQVFEDQAPKQSILFRNILEIKHWITTSSAPPSEVVWSHIHSFQLLGPSCFETTGTIKQPQLYALLSELYAWISARYRS